MNKEKRSFSSDCFFLILGYGTPENILVDENYHVYLTIVFNSIFESVERRKCEKPQLIFCGGNTDFFPPYKRTEAEEMIRFFKNLQRDTFRKKVSRGWRFLPENKSLSTLENLLFAEKIIAKKRKSQAGIFIFCEKTREHRIKILARKIFLNSAFVQIIPIDFDKSSSRYLGKFVEQKEKLELKHSLWALKNSLHLKKHHLLFQEKMAILRTTSPEKRAVVLKNFWSQKMLF